jgi:hypothetical protein
MQDYSAIAIAAAFALVGVIPLAGRNLSRPLFWACALAGAITGPIAREGTQMAWEWLGPVGALANNPAGSTVYLLITAAIGELVKATAPLAVVSFVPTNAVAAIAYGAAAGAGFGFMATQQVLALAMKLVGSTFITPLSTGIAIIGWFFPMLAHTATTAYVARAGVRGGLGPAFLFAWVVQFALGLALRLPVIAGVALGTVVTAIIALGLFASLWVTRNRAMSGSPAQP